jgi:alginate O-acetyltransferase complex protein AlgI
MIARNNNAEGHRPITRSKSKRDAALLFNSFPFIFAFLPVSLFAFFILGRSSHRAAAAWLALASFFFYGWWNPAYVILFLASIVFNFTAGARLARLHTAGREAQAGRLLTLAVAANLLLLGYYKYTDFFLKNLGRLADLPLALDIVLPLGISFFTFTQIAFLVDARRGEAKEYSFVHYCLFVTYFPHLIAGPILHHGEMMPQFRRPATYRMKWEDMALGLTVFLIGLYKKTVLADGIAEYVAPAFNAAAAGGAPTLLDAWGSALAYTFQIYFDFSGYSDMAIGLSRLFGITLPLNFDSPYKASSIIDFWRRWHITLSRFLRDYLYFSLGGNRRGAARRYLNLFLTMLIGGLWHGAGWTFVCWGALHGIYLALNHGWRSLCATLRLAPDRVPGWAVFARLLTFVAVVVGWVLFRATNLDAALAMLKGMAGMNGVVLPERWLGVWGVFGNWLLEHGVRFAEMSYFKAGTQVNWLWILLLVCWVLPNTQEIMAAHRPGLVSPGYRPILPGQSAWNLTWKPSPAWLALMAGFGIYALLSLTEFSEFIYFQF